VTRSAQGVLLACGALSAVVAATSGWVLSHEEGYGGELLDGHERAGITVAVAAVLAALVHGSGARASAGARLRIYQVLLGIARVTLVLAGHLGSEITHGADWLEGPGATGGAGKRASHALATGIGEVPPASGQESRPSPAPLADPAPAGSADDTYAARIAPLLAARCGSCHGATKHKAGLRLDTREGLLAGGEDGPVLVPGDPAASLLFQRVSKPLEDEDHMPPEGRPQPTSEELSALRAWIAPGAHVGAAAEPPPAGTRPPVPGKGAAPAPVKPSGPPGDALGALDRALIHHERAAPDTEDLRIEVAPVAPSFGDAEVQALLVPLADWTVELSLARSAVGDAGVSDLARFPRLRELDLRATRVSAAGLAALAAHPALEELDLAQTKLADAAVDALLAIPHLRKVTLWHAGLSAEALARLRAVPALAVEAGDEAEAAALEREGELAFTSDRPLPGADVVPEALRPVNKLCPVSGEPVNPKYALVHTSASGTRVIGFCCPNCPKEFWADPAKFESKLP
jgi:hypothetical protein